MRRSDRTRLDARDLPAALARLSAGPAGDPPEPAVLCPDPVFLLAAGWRTGSTLVQRMLASDGRTLMWGEPFGDHCPVHRMAQMLEPFAHGDPHTAKDLAHFEGKLSEEWIANLNPGLAALRRAHLAWFEALFAAPAREGGHARWGCKWVRLSAFHAHYLRWLYPQARIVFLVRHPLDALSSYAGIGGLGQWYLLRPEHPVRSSHHFLKHWGRLAGSFLSEWDGLGALLLRYEDLVADAEESKRLAAHAGCEIDPGVLARSVGATRKPGPVPAVARLEARLRLSSLLARLGYTAKGERLALPVEARR